ncbi:hypothetical protein ACQBAU_12895 [Propionibacteriaceae bacterium Y2011]
MLASAIWGIGAVFGPVTVSGAGVLRADYFTLLPIDRRRLALGLLGATFPGVASGYLLLAFAAVGVHAVVLSPATLLVVLVAVPLLWVITIALSRVVYGVLGAAMQTWLGIEISGIQFGFLIASLFTGWMVVTAAIPDVPGFLATGLPDSINAGLGWFPTSWPLQAVEAAAAGNLVGAVGWLAGLLGLAAVLLLLAAQLLRPDLGSSSTSGRQRRPAGSRVLTGRPLLPDTALGAVVGKELRQWWRDPWRKLELRSSVYAGLFVGLFAYVSGDYAVVAPLSGLVIAWMVSMGGCNLYGQDGSAAWLSIVGQRADTVRAEVWGRQIALLLLFAPPAVIVSGGLVLLSRAWWSIPVLLGGLAALLGVSAGMAVLVSAGGVSPGVDPRRRVGPNDAGGDLTLQGQVAFWGVALLIVPTAAVLAAGLATGVELITWIGVGVGIVNGVLGSVLLGRMTVGYLERRLPVVFARIRYPGDLAANAGGGFAGWLEKASHQSEITAAEEKAKEKRKRVEARKKKATAAK